MKYNNDFVNGKVREIFKPGACLISDGKRGGGKTHTVVSYCQRIMEGDFPNMPEHVILVTNIIFVKKVGDSGAGKKDFIEETPENVHSIRTIKEYFPIVADAMDRYDDDELLILFVLDEAQNYLMGDMNSTGDFAKAFKSFAGLLRKWNTVAWFITPAMRNMTPAFRNFIDAPSDAGNVTCIFSKKPEKVRKYIAKKHLDMDERDIVYIKQGAEEKELMMPVPTSSWTRPHDTLEIGEYAYDTKSSAAFDIGDGFPFFKFIYHVSGISSYRMADAIHEFYHKLETEDSEEGEVDRDKIERSVILSLMKNAIEHKIPDSVLVKIFGENRNRVQYLKSLARAKYGIEGKPYTGEKVAEKPSGEAENDSTENQSARQVVEE